VPVNDLRDPGQDESGGEVFSKMRHFVAGIMALALGGVLHLSAADIAIGQLSLTGPNFGGQTVSLYNLTGATTGCEQAGPQYDVCNGININTWQLEVDFTANAAGLPPSPLIFTSNGPGDIVGPTDASFDPYTGETGNPWTLSFDQVNTGCDPDCDAQISQIVFSGTVDTTALQLFNDADAPGGQPYVLDTLPSASFTTTWAIPVSDYTNDPDNLFDQTDVTISDVAAPAPGTPEPGSIFLFMAGTILTGIGFLTRQRTLSRVSVLVRGN
jgi:hypothetical protein